MPPIQIRLAAVPADGEDRTPARVDVIENEIRFTIIRGGGEYMAQIDAASPVSSVAIVMHGEDSTEHELKIELDRVNTDYRWHGGRILGTLEHIPIDRGTRTIKAFVLRRDAKHFVVGH
jgi:hypothetical protein